MFKFRINMRVLVNILVLLLASALLFAGLRYINYLKENITDLKYQKQNLLSELEKEKIETEKLKSENKGLIYNLKAAYQRLYKSFAEVKTSEKKVEEVNARMALLKAENASLMEEKTKLTEENEAFRSTLTSIPDLKVLIRDLKRFKADGNQGFLIKSGQSKSTSKVKIEVVPASSK